MRKAEDVKNYGRAHQAGKAIFYGATNIQLACGEVLQDMKYKFNPQWEPGFCTVSV